MGFGKIWGVTFAVDGVTMSDGSRGRLCECGMYWCGLWIDIILVVNGCGYGLWCMVGGCWGWLCFCLLRRIG